MILTADDFNNRDIYIDYPYEDAKFRWEHATKKVYRRFYGQKEIEIPHSSDLYHQGISAGKEISREEYFRD